MNDGLAEFVESLRRQGLMGDESARRALALETSAHVPLASEIHALLYLGAALILAGVGAAVKDRLNELGPLTLLAAVGLAAAACFLYCFRFARPFASSRVESPTAAFDYALYLACGLVGIFFSYLEWKWKLLGNWWDLYLFLSGLLFAALAYRFDNRLVLTTGLLNLAAWLGFRMSLWRMPVAGTRALLVAYGAALFALGMATQKGAVKPHFAETFLRLGTHLALCTLLFDAAHIANPQLWLLLIACAALGTWSLTERRFESFAAAVGYAYVASLAVFMTEVRPGADSAKWTIVLSAGAVIAVLLWARARLQEAA